MKYLHIIFFLYFSIIGFSQNPKTYAIVTNFTSEVDVSYVGQDGINAADQMTNFLRELIGIHFNENIVNTPNTLDHLIRDFHSISALTNFFENEDSVKSIQNFDTKDKVIVISGLIKEYRSSNNKIEFSLIIECLHYQKNSIITKQKNITIKDLRNIEFKTDTGIQLLEDLLDKKSNENSKIENNFEHNFDNLILHFVKYNPIVIKEVEKVNISKQARNLNIEEFNDSIFKISLSVLIDTQKDIMDQYNKEYYKYINNNTCNCNQLVESLKLLAAYLYLGKVLKNNNSFYSQEGYEIHKNLFRMTYDYFYDCKCFK